MPSKGKTLRERSQQRTKKLSIQQRIKVVDQYFDAKTQEINRQFLMYRSSWLEGRFDKLEEERNILRQKYDDLVEKLTALLSNEQLEAAKTVPCAPEEYAINWMKICVERSEAEKYNIKMQEQRI